MCYYVGNEYVLNLKSLSEVPSIETESVMPNKTPLSIIEHDTDFAVDVVKIDTSSVKLITITSAEQASRSYCFHVNNRNQNNQSVTNNNSCSSIIPLPQGELNYKPFDLRETPICRTGAKRERNTMNRLRSSDMHGVTVINALLSVNLVIVNSGLQITSIPMKLL